MNNEKPDYSILISDNDWSIVDAEFIVESYNRYLLSSQDISDFSAVDAYTRKLIQSTNAFTNTDKIVHFQLFDECGYPEYDDANNEVWLTDLDKTKVNIKDFIKWAYREGIPLPEEIMDMVRPVAKKQSPVGSVDPGNIIEATIQAILYCLDNDQKSEVSSEDIISYLARKGFKSLDENVLNEISTRIPEDIRTAAVSLTAKNKREYGMLKKQKENMDLSIQATAKATEYIIALKPGNEINDLDMYKWLYANGVQTLTDRMLDQIWQALPPKNKKPSGKSTKKE